MRLAMLAFQQKNVVMAQADITRGDAGGAGPQPAGEQLPGPAPGADRAGGRTPGGFLEDGSASRHRATAAVDRTQPVPRPGRARPPAALLRAAGHRHARGRAGLLSPPPAARLSPGCGSRSGFPTPPAVLRPAHGPVGRDRSRATSGTTFPSTTRAGACPSRATATRRSPCTCAGRASACRWCAGARPSAAGAPSWPPTGRSTCATRTRTWARGSGATWWPRRSGCRPPSSPLGSMVKEKWVNGAIVRVTNYDEVGPGYLSAYGLVAGIHVEPRPRPGGAGYFDNGIRTHGTFDYTSLRGRFSHGCHRLHNNLAVRLFSFVLRHRHAAAAGARWRWISGAPSGRRARCSTCACPPAGSTSSWSRPLPVETLPGTIKGQAQKPIAGYVRKPGVIYASGARRPPRRAGPKPRPAVVPLEGNREPTTRTVPGLRCSGRWPAGRSGAWRGASRRATGPSCGSLPDRDQARGSSAAVAPERRCARLQMRRARMPPLSAAAGRSARGGPAVARRCG